MEDSYSQIIKVSNVFLRIVPLRFRDKVNNSSQSQATLKASNYIRLGIIKK